MYSGTYKQKKVIKLAPDAIVRINGEPRITICPVCKAKINVSKYITSLSTSLANNTTIGNAQFTIAMPRHGDDGVYMVRGGKIYGLNLMDEVEIFIKGRFLSSDKTYQYNKVFWGLICTISESYSDGVQTVSVGCESMLKWLQLMSTNENPALMALEGIPNIDMSAVVATSKTYANLNPYQIIYSLVNITLLNMVLPTQFDLESDVSKGMSIADKKRVSATAGWGGEKDKKLIEYWAENFAKIKGSLKMFGTSESSFSDVVDSKLSEANSATNDIYAGGKTKYVPQEIFYDSRALMSFRPFFKPEEAKKGFETIHNTYKNNLEIASEVRIMTGFEFYLDTTGDIIFKPPFWNVDTRSNPVYFISDDEIVGWDFQESEEPIVTRVEVTGSLNQYANIDSIFVPRGIFTNYNLARQFGIRPFPVTMRFFTNANMCYYHAISEMDRINSERYKASITIIGRSELRLGLPVYIESRDIFGYVDNISHNFTFGGPYQTQIHLSAIRRKYFGADPMSDGHSFNKQGDSSTAINYKGDPVILIYDGELKDNSFYESVAKDLQPKIKEASKNNTALEKESLMAMVTDYDTLLKTNRFGNYVEYALSSTEAQKYLKFADNAKDTQNRDSYLNFLDRAIPVSDEEGYELIGSYENGRSLSLDENGFLKKKGKSFADILEKALTKSNGVNNNYSGNSANFVNVTVNSDKTSNATLRSDDRGNPDKDLNTSKDVRDYFKDKSSKLAAIRPEQDTVVNVGCSCYDPHLKSVPLKDIVSSGNKQSLISSKK